MSPALADVVDAAGTAGELRRLGEGNGAVAGLRRSPSASAYALIARKARLFEVLARADAVVAPSRFLLQMFAAAGFPADKMTHIAYGVDPGRLASAAAAADARNKATSARLRIGYVGSISPHKGLQVLINAVRRLPAGDWQLDVHGSLDTHPEYTARIQRLARGAQRIVFHGAFVPSELGFVLSQLDVVVVPSLWYENTPFSVLEALAAGIPVVASDLGGITEVVAEGSNGFLFPPGDRRALTARLAAILADRGVLARLHPVPPRTIGANVDDFVALYRRIAGAEAVAR
jgi:glycosyltransferase involved in cell wall biosynthesis